MSAARCKRVKLDFVNNPELDDLKMVFDRKVVRYYRKNLENILNYYDFLESI